MNAKLAKALRRKARNVTDDAPDVLYGYDKRKKGTTVLVHPHTTKGVYRTVKKHVAKERRA